MWSKQVVELLITRYKEHENLYDMAHPNYVDRVKRSISLFAICKELKKLEPDINEEAVKKKIHTLRSQYLKELREMEALKLKNHEDFEVYQPKLWCFSQLHFLKPYCSIKKLEKFSVDERVKIVPKSRRFAEEKEDMANVVVDAFEESGNDLSVLAQGWSSQYDELTKSQKVFARKIISDVLFHGCLDNLNENIVRAIQNIFASTAENTYDPLNSD